MLKGRREGGEAKGGGLCVWWMITRAEGKGMELWVRSKHGMIGD